MSAAAIQDRFGAYGGRYVPEVLIGALDELSAVWAATRDDPGFRRELDALLRDYVGRPTPLYRADRLSERIGRRVYLKREDLAHTGAHKINNAIGQALLARGMGKRRVIAETGAGQHGVAAATACALLGLECVVYMGTEDIRRQAPNVERMRLLGAEVVPVEAGARTLKEAVSAAIRDWVANVRTTHYIIGSAVGPAPYPALVRDLQRVIGDEARQQAQAAEGKLPARVIACVGGGSNAIGTFYAFLDDQEVELIGVEAGERGSTAATARRWSPGERGSCTARCPPCSQTSRGRSSRPTRSRRGSTTRVSAQSTPTFATPVARATRRSPMPRPCVPSGSWLGWRASCPRSSPRTQSPGFCRIRVPPPTPPLPESKMRKRRALMSFV